MSETVKSARIPAPCAYNPRRSGLTAGDVVAGDYRVIRPLRAGGMGAVYVVEQLSTGRARAMKVLLPTAVDDASCRAALLGEARITSSIRSDHVVEIVAAGVDQELALPFVVMELLDGSDLADWVAEYGPMSPLATRRVLLSVCHALERAHATGIVHRDIKPENVFVSHARGIDGEPVIKVLDFGVATQSVDGWWTSTEPLGSPLFMAPEQTAADTRVGPPTDVWALGLLAFFLLTGESYWLGAEKDVSVLCLMRELLFDALPAASTRAAQLGKGPLPVGFDAWFARCVCREQENRFRDAGHAGRALARVLVTQLSTISSPEPKAEVDSADVRLTGRPPSASGIRALWRRVAPSGVRALMLLGLALPL